jgi:uncharacterized protein (TIGR00369 family)
MSHYTAERPEDLPTQAELLGLSGLDFMRGVFEGRLSAPPIGKLMNFRLDLVEHGRVVFRGAPDFAATNPMGGVHGGWYGTILDSCMGCAVMTTLAKGSYYTTLEYKINITRAIPIGTEVLAEGRIQHAGRSTGVAMGEIRGAVDGKLYATGSTTCLVMSAG